MFSSKSSKSKFESSIINITIIILFLTIVDIILLLQIEHSNFFGILFLINTFATAIVGGITIVKIIKNTLKK